MKRIIPPVSAAQMRRIDESMAALGIVPGQLMEHAGHRIAAFVRDRTKAKRVLVLAGKGNNGGDGLVAARFLHSWGYDVRIVPLTGMHPLPAQHWRTLRALGIRTAKSFDAGIIIDALLGYANRAPRGTCASLISNANRSGIPILAVDAPSGLDPDTGTAYAPCVKATWTVTLALPKHGLLRKAAKPYVGELCVADIGIPPEAYKALGLRVRLPSDLVRLRY